MKLTCLILISDVKMRINELIDLEQTPRQSLTKELTDEEKSQNSRNKRIDIKKRRFVFWQGSLFN